MHDLVCVAIIAVCITFPLAYHLGFSHGRTQGEIYGDAKGWFRCYNELARKERDRRG